MYLSKYECIDTIDAKEDIPLRTNFIKVTHAQPSSLHACMTEIFVKNSLKQLVLLGRYRDVPTLGGPAQH